MTRHGRGSSECGMHAQRPWTRRIVLLAAALLAACVVGAPPLLAGDGPNRKGVAPKGEVQGGDGGDEFRDAPAGRLASVWLRAGRWIDAIGCSWESGGKTKRSPWHGGTGGDVAVVHLDPGESVTQVRGVLDAQGFVGSLTLVTSRQREWGPYGTTLDGPKFELSAGPGEEICGFRGRSRSYLDALGILVRPTTATSAPAAGTAHTRAGEPVPEPAWLRTRVEEIARRAALPSLAASLVVDGEVVAMSAVGVRMLGAPDPVQPDDAYLLGSVTKPITATLVGRCVDRGLVRWETTLAEMFPELKASMRPEYRKATVAQLLSHTSGLPGQPTTPADEIDRRGEDPVARRYQYVKAALADPPVAEPGSHGTYSGGAIVVVAALERLTKRSYDELMRDEIFTPLGLRTAGFGDMATPGRVDGVWGHSAAPGRTVPVPPKPEDATNSRLPVGGVHCSIGDLGRWAAVFLGPRAGAKPYLSEATLRTLTTEVRPGTGLAPGLLVAAVPWAKGRVLWHNGSQGRNYALVHVVPDEGYATCVATNVAGAEDGRVDNACQELHLFIVEHVRSERKGR